MPVKLCDAPGTFRQIVDVILSAVKWQSALVYFDDNAVISKSVEEHKVHAREVLMLFSDAGVTLKLQKCCSIAEAIDYLGHGIRPSRFKIASRRNERHL